MLSRKYFRDFSGGATVIEVIEALKQLPPKAKFTCLGDPRFYIHGEEDGSEVWVDDNPMNDLYEDSNHDNIDQRYDFKYGDFCKDQLSHLNEIKDEGGVASRSPIITRDAVETKDKPSIIPKITDTLKSVTNK